MFSARRFGANRRGRLAVAGTATFRESVAAAATAKRFHGF